MTEGVFVLWERWLEGFVIKPYSFYSIFSSSNISDYSREIFVYVEYLLDFLKDEYIHNILNDLWWSSQFDQHFLIIQNELVGMA